MVSFETHQNQNQLRVRKKEAILKIFALLQNPNCFQVTSSRAKGDNRLFVSIQSHNVKLAVTIMRFVRYQCKYRDTHSHLNPEKQKIIIYPASDIATM